MYEVSTTTTSTTSRAISNLIIFKKKYLYKYTPLLCCCDWNDFFLSSYLLPGEHGFDYSFHFISSNTFHGWNFNYYLPKRLHLSIACWPTSQIIMYQGGHSSKNVQKYWHNYFSLSLSLSLFLGILYNNSKCNMISDGELLYYLTAKIPGISQHKIPWPAKCPTSWFCRALCFSCGPSLLSIKTVQCSLMCSHFFLLHFCCSCSCCCVAVAVLMLMLMLMLLLLQSQCRNPGLSMSSSIWCRYSSYNELWNISTYQSQWISIH